MLLCDRHIASSPAAIIGQVPLGRFSTKRAESQPISASCPTWLIARPHQINPDHRDAGNSDGNLYESRVHGPLHPFGNNARGRVEFPTHDAAQPLPNGMKQSAGSRQGGATRYPATTLADNDLLALCERSARIAFNIAKLPALLAS